VPRRDYSKEEMFTEPNLSNDNEKPGFRGRSICHYQDQGHQTAKLERQGATRISEVAQEGAMHWIVTSRFAIRHCVLAGFPSNPYNQLQRQESGESKGSCNQLQRECQESRAPAIRCTKRSAERIVQHKTALEF
jgi:hypothetical protein